MNSVLLRPASLLLLGAALAACSGEPQSITSPSRSAAGPVFAAQGAGNGKTSLDLIEEDYSAGALDKENANRYRAYAVLAPEKLPPKYKSTVIGKDATESMVRQALEWESLSKSTQQEILDLRANGFGNLKQTFETAHFALHYATESADAVPALDSDGDGTPDFIEVAAESWERVWQRQVTELGYPAPVGTPAQKFHVYFKQIPYYGYAMPTNLELIRTSPVYYGTASAFIVINNDFYGFPVNDEDDGSEVVRSGALKVTQAHEFMHAIQFAINVYASIWLMESHATWAEDMVYDEINDWHWYINRFLETPDLPIFRRFLYGAAYFQHYLSERSGVDVMRRIWEGVKSQTTAAAIQDVAFGGSWEAMKAFAPAEYLHDISDFTSDPASVVESRQPLASLIRSDGVHESYPVSVDVPASTNREPNRAPWALGANFVDFRNASGSLTVTFDGADGFAWRAYVIATAKNGGRTEVRPLSLDGASAGSITVDGMGTRWANLTLAVTIADESGVAVPFSYRATISRGGTLAD